MALPVTVPNPMFEHCAPFCFRKVDGAYLLTNATGAHVFLGEGEFEAFIENRLDPESVASKTLAGNGFVRASLDHADFAARVERRKRFLDYGPNLHVVEVTLRCNETCTYCHSSRAGMEAVDRDMSVAVADQVVDFALRSTNPSITIEFQGGEPLANFAVIRHIVETALSKNQTAGRTIEFSLVSNLSLMTEEAMEFLLAHRVQICTSIDGPLPLHDKQRRLGGGSAFEAAQRWVKRINEAYKQQGLDPEIYHVEGLLTVTRDTLAQPEAVVDTYVELGFRALSLRPLDPFGFASKTSHMLGYSAEEYLAFHQRVLERMFALNRRGTRILERYASILLSKIMGDDDPNFLDLRSPCGAGIGQIAYGYNGAIFTCDEGRMLGNMGDEFFRIGTIGRSSYRDTIGHDTVRSLTVSSNVLASPDCSQCVYNPYCGLCPVHNYATRGTLHGPMASSSWCKIMMGIQDYLFSLIHRGDPEILSILQQWTTARTRAHYRHETGCAV